MIQLPKILPVPEKPPPGLPKTIKWLSGEGAGSWFLIEKTTAENHYHVSRFSPEGTMECKGLFMTDEVIDLNEMYSLDYPSHCKQVTITQFGKRINLKRQ